MVQSQLDGKYNPVKTKLQIWLKQVLQDDFLRIPLFNEDKYTKYNVNGRFLNSINIEKGNYCSAVTCTVAVDVLVSDCKYLNFL